MNNLLKARRSTILITKLLEMSRWIVKPALTMVLLIAALSLVPDAFAQAPFGNWLELDGTNDYASSPHSADLALAEPSSLTVEAWFQADDRDPAWAKQRPIISKQGAWSIDIEFKNSFDGQDSVNCYLWSADNAMNGTGVFGVTIGSGWHHIAMVLDNSANTLSLYMDGQRLTSISNPIDLRNSGYPVLIGDEWGSSYLWDGRIDEVRISNIARYSGTTYSVPGTAFTCDASTVALWHFDECASATTFYDGGDGPASQCGTVEDTAIGYNGAATAGTLPCNYTISGTVTNGGSPFSGVVMNGLPGNPTTNGSGFYTATVSAGWSGTVTPTLAGYTFSPTQTTYSNVSANQTTNYTVVLPTYQISGTITVGSEPLAGVVMSGLPGNPSTNGSGIYSANVDSGWSGTATPTLAGYTFVPPQTTYSNVTSNQTNDYAATRVYTVTFLAGANGSLTGTTTQVLASGGNCTPVTAMANSGYMFTNWTGNGGFTTSWANPLLINDVTADMVITANFTVFSERAVLIALYNATNGDGWTHNTGWKTPPLYSDGFAMPGTEDSWYGITSDSDHVRYIELSNDQLTGSIPALIGNLTNLWTLNLSRNQLTDRIPVSIGWMISLTTLNILDNQLVGSIPSEIGNTTNLVYLYLSHNQLSGNMPSEIGNLTNLEELDLSSNQVTGDIPASIGNLGNLQYLWLDSNHFTRMPAEIGSLIKLKYLVLSDNELTGNIPAQIGNLTNLASLVIHNNHLTGPIPVELGNLMKLQSLLLASNQLTGSIPPELGNLTNLQSLQLSSNQLTGPIPVELGNLTNLRNLYLSGNQLMDLIPTQLSNLTNLRRLLLDSNKLAGVVPSSIINLTNLLADSSNLRWNGLYSSDPAVVAFLNSKQTGGDWQSTQTIAPTNVSAVANGTTSITVSWTPIAYTGDTGGYRVFYGTTTGGPFSFYAQTSNKTISSMVVTGLNPGTPYFFAVTTRTDAHGYQQNTIDSDFSDEATATTQTVFYTISGTITAGGAPLAGVVMTGLPGNPSTNGTGFYTADVVSGWSGTVTPTLACYRFTPTSREYNSVNANQSAQDYTAVSYSINPTSTTIAAAGGDGSVSVTAGDGCAWTAVSNDPWITVTPPGSGSGVGSVEYAVAANLGPPRSGTITIAGITFTINQASAQTAFYPVTPCRVFDTRNSSGSPILDGGEHRNFDIAGICGIPIEAKAIVANVTVVNGSVVGNMSIIAGNLTSTLTTTIEIPLARARANNATIQLATDGEGTIMVINNSSGTVNLILDVNGYFQ